MKRILLLTFMFSMVFMAQVFAKNKLDLSDTSVLLLKTFNDEGKVIRSQDVPVEKVDVSDDTVRVNELKKQYFKECSEVDINPDISTEHDETIENDKIIQTNEKTSTKK